MDTPKPVLRMSDIISAKKAMEANRPRAGRNIIIDLKSHPRRKELMDTKAITKWKQGS